MKITVGILTAPHIDFVQKEKTFILRNVRIGIGFHWDRYEDQEFEGTLTILHNEDGTETAINTIDLEDYLTCVISSEMSADSSMELLKAHTIIARSWAMSMIERRQRAAESTSAVCEFHAQYDVCADDHCQRYEGIRRRNERAIQAVRDTAGLVLVYPSAGMTDLSQAPICDCRYSKCCGGRTEEYETCWEDRHIPYLESVECPYCNTRDIRVLSTVLNSYDQETMDFHDWSARYTTAELSTLIARKSGIDFGEIIDLRPLRRGKSGRIYELEIVGTERTMVISKELKIRQWLSPSHLYSSWFNIRHVGDIWLLDGHGWGHGVGLCQIGAAVMGEQGFTYQQILAHYYRGSQLCVR